jgi:hypothetical protein
MDELGASRERHWCVRSVEGIGCCIFHAGLLLSTGESRFRWAMPFCLGRFLCTRFDMVGRVGFLCLLKTLTAANDWVEKTSYVVGLS